VTATLLRCMVDASVAIKLFVSEPGSDLAEQLFGQLAVDPPAELYVPDLFYIECANLFWKYVRSSHYAATTAANDAADLRRLALHSTPTFDLITDALNIAVSHGITAYDSCYVALAHRLGVPLVTADEPLVQRLTGASYSVYELKKFPLPAGL
jgi:predicted nucleic acid-binding protein